MHFHTIYTVTKILDVYEMLASIDGDDINRATSDTNALVFLLKQLLTLTVDQTLFPLIASQFKK